MMNERIRELAEQAMWHTNSKTGEVYRTHFQFEEKFAELIVRECANQCTHDGPFTAEVVWGKQFREKILKHFGIDE